jgi:hypothetical protein
VSDGNDGPRVFVGDLFGPPRKSDREAILDFLVREETDHIRFGRDDMAAYVATLIEKIKHGEPWR